MLIATEVTEIVAAVDAILRKSFGKQLFYPKQDDQIRLLRLKIWSERHKVSITYILSKLVPRFEYLANKHGRKPKVGKSQGIGTTISVLTGPAAEAFLKECIEKEFPDGENIIAWREDTQRECFAKITEDEGEAATRKPKGILDYPTIAAFRRAYAARIESSRIAEDKLVKQLAKQPWRGNPFR